MAVRKVLQIGDPLLKIKNLTVNKNEINNFKQLVDDLVDTMRSEDIIGIAAPQIGKNFKLFVTEVRPTEYRPNAMTDKLRVYFNPKIIKFSEEKSIIYEGCGSVGKDFFGPVERPKEITIQAVDQNGKDFTLRCNGMLARVIQHEYDHLDGIEFIEKINDYKKVMNFEHFSNLIRTSDNQIKPSIITVIEEL